MVDVEDVRGMHGTAEAIAPRVSGLQSAQPPTWPRGGNHGRLRRLPPAERWQRCADVSAEIVCVEWLRNGLPAHGTAGLVLHGASVTEPLRARAHLEPPMVGARRILEDDSLEIVCPYCDRLHYHGGRGRPGDGDGHRLAHCTHPDARPGYVLREVGAQPRRSRPRYDSPYYEPNIFDHIYGAPRVRRSRSPVSVNQRARIMERDDFHCRRCGCGPRDERLVVDHVIPVASGGSSDDENLQTLCEPCNQGKGARPPHPHDLRGLT